MIKPKNRNFSLFIAGINKRLLNILVIILQFAVV
jgi:hypothetical protein